MALVKFGAGIVSMAGKIAGTVFARNRSGQYARAWAKPVNVNSPRQQQIRGLMGQLTNHWDKLLDEAERQAWNEYAAAVPVVNRLGEVTTLSGVNMFVRTNAVALLAGRDIIDAAPLDFNLGGSDSSFAIEVDIAEQKFDVTFDDGRAWVDSNVALMVVSIGMPQNENIKFFNGPWRNAGYILGNSASAPASPATLELPFVVGEGQKVFARARILEADGRLSNWFRCEAPSVPSAE